MDNFPIVRDLVVDLESFFAKHRAMLAPPREEGRPGRSRSHPTGEYLMTPRSWTRFVQFTYCIKCGLCSSSCPTSSTDALFPGPQALAAGVQVPHGPKRDEAGEERLELVDNAARRLEVPLRGDVLRGLPQGGGPRPRHPAPEEARHVGEAAREPQCRTRERVHALESLWCPRRRALSSA